MSVLRAAALAAGLAALGAAAAADAPAGRVARPVVRVEQPGACVEPTEAMRRNHMKFLLHQRDRTVREGVRTTRHSLKECVECHASRATGSVLGRDGFCESCHRYASVSIDCFECHASDRQRRVAGRK
jgi:hypothetical protein